MIESMPAPCKPFNPRRLHTHADHRKALKYVERLMDAAPNSTKGDELDLWTTLLEQFEELHQPILPPEPINAIRFRMEQEGLQPIDMIPFFGTRSRVSEVLSGKRSLSLQMIRAIHERLDIPAEILIKPIAVSGRARR